MSGLVARSAQWQSSGGGSAPAFGGASRDFDGSSYIDLGDVLDQGQQSFTVAAWINTADASTGSSVVRPILAKQSTSSPYLGVNFSLLGRKPGLTNSRGDVVFGYILGAHTVPVNSWVHVCAVLDGSDRTNWKIYVDGISVSFFEGGFDLSGSGADNSESLLIGKRPIGECFDGLLSDVRIYLGTVMTSGDVATLAGGGHVATGLSGWWITDTDDVLDYSGNGNHGTNYGSTYSTDGPLD